MLEYTMYTFMVGTWEMIDEMSAKYIHARRKAVTLESSPTSLCPANADEEIG